MEFNASDARSKAVIDGLANSLAGNRTLRFGNAGSNLNRSVIIMDECDGMAGGDKGGCQALIKLIQATKNPVICICNDRSDAQVRQLATHCYDLRFRRPENVAVAKRIKSIVQSEGRKVEMATVEAIVEACGQDIRQVINHLQFFGTIMNGGRACQKDSQVMMSTFEACSRLLSPHREPLPLERRMDMYYVDSELMPIMVQENYLRAMDKKPAKMDELAVLERAAQASWLIATADGWSNNFELMNSAALVGTVYPSALMTSPDQAFAKPSFPAFLMKQGTINKNDRITQDLSSRIRRRSTCGSREFITSNYHDVFHRRLMQMLVQGSSKECAEALHAHGLTREFFTDQAPAFRQPLQLEDTYRKVDVTVRTRLLQDVQNLAMSTVVAAKRKKKPEEDATARRRKSGGGQTSEKPEDVEMEDAEAADDGDIPGLVKRKPGSKAAPKKKALKDTEKDLSKCSLNGWRASVKEKAMQTASQVTPSQADAKPLLVMKYIEGHTCSVRRKIRMRDILGAWNMF